MNSFNVFKKRSLTTDDILRGERLERLFRNDDVKEIVERARFKLALAILDTAPEDKERRENLYFQAQGIGLINEIAQADINNARVERERTENQS